MQTLIALCKCAVHTLQHAVFAVLTSLRYSDENWSFQYGLAKSVWLTFFE